MAALILVHAASIVMAAESLLIGIADDFTAPLLVFCLFVLISDTRNEA